MKGGDDAVESSCKSCVFRSSVQGDAVKRVDFGLLGASRGSNTCCSPFTEQMECNVGTITHSTYWFMRERPKSNWFTIGTG